MKLKGDESKVTVELFESYQTFNQLRLNNFDFPLLVIC